MPHVAIVGGGISGLAAALRLRGLAGPDLTITVLDQADRPGGKLRTATLAGVPVDQGAEAFLLRDPAGAELVRRVGLGDDLVHPAPVPAAIAVGGALRPLPRGTFIGVPGDLAALADSEVARATAEPARDAPLLDGTDVAVGALVRRQLGDEVNDRLVDPMLGGVYAGRSDDLSLATTMPALADAAQRETTLVAAVRAAQRATAAAAGAGPVFGTVRGGLGRLVDAVTAASGARLRLGLPVRELARTGTGWRLTVGPTRNPSYVDVDAVVLAVPARPAARLLAPVSAAAAAEVGMLDYASVALVTLVLPRGSVPRLSGFLVPAVEGYAIKAATFLSRKWPHTSEAAGPATVLRASLGRYGDEQVLQRDDKDLVELVRHELAELVGPLPVPVDAAVQRWGGALPQYTPGHLDRVRRARTALAGESTLALAGAGYDGVGIPACIRSGQAAADRVLAGLAEQAQSSHGRAD